MLDPRSEYLHALDTVLAKEAEPAVARAVRQEIAAHLDAAIQARMELGDSPEEATHQAIAALGTPKGIATGIASVHGSSDVNEHRTICAGWGLAALISTYLFVLPFTVGAQLINTQFLGLYVILTLCLLTLIGVFSCLSRRIAPLRLAIVALAAGAGVWFGSSTLWLDIGREGGRGVMPRWQVEAYQGQMASELTENRLRQEAQRSMMAAPASQGDLLGSLKRQLDDLVSQAASIEEQKAALEAAGARTVPERLVATVGDGIGTAGGAWIGMMAFNLAGAWLGRLWQRRRKSEEVARV